MTFCSPLPPAARVDAMGSTIRQLQEQVRELEKTNRMQAVEIWQLKEEKRDFEKKVELLLNMGSGVSIAEEERPATRKISFGQVFYSDGSVQREVGAEIENGEAFEDVEEVDAVTIQGLENTGESYFAFVEFKAESTLK